MKPAPSFFHVDLDAFFASVEQLDFPQYRGKPVIVGARPGTRGVVSTCSYEAREYGVRSAMPIRQAYRLCPQAIFIAPRMERYREKSAEVMSILDSFTPDVYRASIDEASLNMTGTERLFGDAARCAEKIKKTAREQTGLTLSIGTASNPYIAKIASDYRKPDGLTVVPAGEEVNFIDSVPLKKIWGIGSKTLERLQRRGFRSVPELRRAGENALKNLLGAAQGSALYCIACGRDPGIYRPSAGKSVSAEKTFERDLSALEDMDAVLLELSHDIMFRLMDGQLIGRSIQLKIRYADDFSTVSIQETPSAMPADAETLYETARALLRKKHIPRRAVRLLGLSVHNAAAVQNPAQGELFPEADDKKRRAEEAILALKKKHPNQILKKARLLNPHNED